MLRRLSCVADTNVPNTPQMKSVFNRTKGVLALPGYGKSTEIARGAKDGDLVIAMSSLAVANLREKIKSKGVQVMSLEAACLRSGMKINTLWVDEATMITY